MKKTLDIKKLILLNMPYILLGAVCYQFRRGMANGTRGGCFRKVSFAGCGSAWGAAKFLAKPASIGLVGRAVLRCWSEAGGVS